jgi:hypothetical protein
MEDVDSNKFKGWNINRRWFVEDEGVVWDEYFQNVVREDDVAPCLTPFRAFVSRVTVAKL